MSYNTGNPVPSTDFRDLSDNTQNIDLGMTSSALTFTDRMGVARKTWFAMETDFATAQAARAATFAAGEATRAALTANLANSSDPAKGSALVGHEGTTVKLALDALGPAASPTFTALTLTGAGVKFPAAQVPSADPNTLDDYEEGTWTPTLTFVTPGNLTVTYTTRLGTYTKTGRQVDLCWQVLTSAFTWTTGSGQVLLTGAPFNTLAIANGPQAIGSLAHQGPTMASTYVTISPYIIQSSSQISFFQSSPSAGLASLTATNFPTGTVFNLYGSLSYGAI